MDILNVPPEAQAKCEDFICGVLQDIRFAEVAVSPFASGKSKRQLKTIVSRIRAARHSLSELLPDRAANSLFREGHSLENIEKRIESALATKSAPRHRLSHRQRAAVEGAALLLSAYRRPLVTSR